MLRGGGSKDHLLVRACVPAKQVVGMLMMCIQSLLMINSVSAGLSDFCFNLVGRVCGCVQIEALSTSNNENKIGLKRW